MDVTGVGETRRKVKIYCRHCGEAYKVTQVLRGGTWQDEAPGVQLLTGASAPACSSASSTSTAIPSCNRCRLKKFNHRDAETQRRGELPWQAKQMN
jgi:hypothetical protein